MSERNDEEWEEFINSRMLDKNPHLVRINENCKEIADWMRGFMEEVTENGEDFLKVVEPITFTDVKDLKEMFRPVYIDMQDFFFDKNYAVGLELFECEVRNFELVEDMFLCVFYELTQTVYWKPSNAYGVFKLIIDMNKIFVEEERMKKLVELANK